MEFSDDDDHVILVCTTPNSKTTETLNNEITVSATDILDWDLPTILSFQTIKVHAHRSRLIQQSLFFRDLFLGTLRESSLGSVTIKCIAIKWNLPLFMQILKHVYGCQLDITEDNATPLHKAARYFGVETLISKCERFVSIRDCLRPNDYEYESSIVVPPIHASSYEIDSELILIIMQRKFGGEATENPYAHLFGFVSLCRLVKIDGATDDAIRLRLFPFSLADKAEDWLWCEPKRSIYTWDDLANKFMKRFFPPYEFAKKKNEITSFVQQDNEFLYDAWERYNELLRRCPRHSLPQWLQVQTFYNGLRPSTRFLLDAACGGSVNFKTPEEVLDIIETMAADSPEEAIMAQNKVLSQQLERLAQQLSSMQLQAKAGATPTRDCDFYKDQDENRYCQANQHEEQVNISGQQNSFSHGWQNQFNFSRGLQGSQGNSSFQGQGQSFSGSGDRLTSLEDTVSRLAINTSDFVSESRSSRTMWSP